MQDLGKRLFLEPLAPARNRAAEVSERIAAEIASGRLAPGDRLPAEHELMAAMGVSRSVVREAVAALRSDGLVVTRQGAGAFVASDPARVPFRIDPNRLSAPAGIAHLMELRLAVEVEASALAAERAAAAGLKSIERTLRAIDLAVAEDGAAIEQDAAFHRAIAIASGNPMFDAFLAFLGRHIIPRQDVRAEIAPGPARKAYLEKIQREHRLIAQAIGQRDPTGARRAMRTHLVNGLNRYRELAAQFPRVNGTLDRTSP
jgi:GntR family transcriptional regulator, transcriptional repressor for pyruvate dehydrogenase complex